jgi:hypothetical protein
MHPAASSSSVITSRARSISSTSSLAAINCKPANAEDEAAENESIIVPSALSITSTSSLATINRKPTNAGDEAAVRDDEVIVSKIWPTEFYAVDIVEAFRFIYEMEAVGINSDDGMEEWFGFQFEGILYVRSTFNAHLHRWMHASQSAKAKALAAGRTPAGLWSTFMAENPSV